MDDRLKRALDGKLPITLEETLIAERYEARRADVYGTNHRFRLATIETQFDGVVDVLFDSFFKRPLADIVVLKGTGGIVVIGNNFRVDDILSELEYEGQVVSGSDGTMVSYQGTKTLDEVAAIALRIF